MVRDKFDLIYLAQMNVLEIHCWNVRKDNLNRPDRMVFDLDPDPALPAKKVVEAALILRTA